MSKVDGPAAIAACANLRSRNARSLFISGPTAAAREAGDISSYQPQKSRRTWSRTPAVRRLRVASSPSSGGMSARVTSPEPGGTEPSRVRHAARKMSSVRGPQNPAKIRRKIPVTLSTIMSVSVPLPSPCSTFRHGGACLVSPGSNSTTLPADASGRRAMTSSTASPLGSMKTTPRPASASARICPAISVVLPVPVGPQIRRWWRASGTARPTGRGWPASETPSGRTPGPGSGMAGGGGTARAPARARPGSAGSAGSRAIAASSGTDSRSPLASRREPITAAGGAGGGGPASSAR